MAQSKYFQRVAARRWDDQAVNRGLQAGQDVGKLLGGLATAIQSARKDAIANKLMTDQSISEQPGAGQTIDLGTLPGGPQPNAGDGTQGQTQGLGMLPDNTASPGLGINPDIAPAASDEDFQKAIAESRLTGSQGKPTVGSVPDLNRAVAAARLSQPGDFTLNPSDYSSGMRGVGGTIASGSGQGTVGGLIHTGGVAEMELRDKMLETQYRKAQIADRLAEAAGTGKYAKRATPVTRRGVTMTGDGDGSSVWDESEGGNPPSGKPAKPAKYVAGSGDFEGDETQDNPDHIKTDFEAFHPNVKLSDFVGATKDANGNYTIPGKPDDLGNPTVKATIPKAEGDIVMQRMDAARKRAGLPSSNGAVPAGQGTQDNPVPLTGSKLQLRSLGTGVWVIDPKSKKKFRVGT